MIDEIMSLALGNGLWAALFCLLFLYQLKDSRMREKKYAATIDSLTKSLSGVNEIKQDCAEISDTLLRVKSDCEIIKSDCGKIKADSAAIKSGIIKTGSGGGNAKIGTTEIKQKEGIANLAASVATKADTAKKTRAKAVATDSFIPKNKNNQKHKEAAKYEL